MASRALDGHCRQSAIIAMGLLYMQTSPGKTERVKEFREKLTKVIGDKHEDVSGVESHFKRGGD